MKKEMLINVLQAEECRIAIVEDGLLEELYVERASQESYVGNIYKGRIVNIEPGIQAAFVDFGIGRNGFLHLSDVDPVYYKHLLPKEVRDEMDAEEEAENQRANRNRERDRGERPSRGRSERPERAESAPDRSPEREERRPVRLTEVESAVTLPPPLPRPASRPIEVEDDFGDFGTGIDEPAPEPTPPPLPVEAPVPARTPEIVPPSRPAPSPPMPKAPPIPPLPPQITDDDDDAGFGAGLDDDSPLETTATESVGWELVTFTEIETKVDADLPVMEPVEAEEEARPKAKGRAKATKPKKAEEAVEAPAVEDEAKKPAKPRRGRKKTETEPGEELNDLLDEKPKPMPGAERRISEDDEPEIRPFFTDGPAADFDPDAPNDRFDGNAPPQDAVEETNFADDESSVEEDDTRAPRRNDDDEETERPARPSRDRGGDRGPRGRGSRDRGSDRGGERSNDRGPDRGPPRERGPRPGFTGGNGGGRPPMRDRAFQRPPIQDIFKRGQEVIVQVIKEAIGTKAPNLSTFISIAGRYLVLMPSLNRVGVSRKIEDIDARKRLREIMNRLNPPKGVGFIVRTAAIDRNEVELQNDLAYLLRLWQVVAKRIKRVASPVEIYRESDMITRTIRDNFTSDINTIYVDEPNAFAQASEFLQIVMPRFADRIRFFSDTEPLFNKYGVEDEISKINNKRIDLPLGGSIIIEQTEALVAIDVNSGNFRADNNAEETAFQVNLIAAKEIARQLRLRDLGGVIVNDFIDMRSESHRRKVEDALRYGLRRDRARTKILRISQFGIIEMTRQRIQPSLKKRIFNECSHCKGTGYVKNNETISIEVMRHLQLAAHRAPLIVSMTITMHTEAAFYLLNKKRKDIAALELKAGIEVQIDGKLGVSPEHLEYRCLDTHGNEVRLFAAPAAPAPRPMRGGGQREFRGNDRRVPALD
jgi:ribonuclease E